MPSSTEPRPHDLHWFPSLHMPPKQMAFVGHSQMCPDSSDGSFQMALPLGNAEIPVLSVLPQSCPCREISTPSPNATNTACICFSKPSSLCCMPGKEWWLRRGSTLMDGMVGVIETNRYIHLVQDMQNVMGTRRMVQEPKCVIRKGVPEEAAPAWTLKRWVREWNILTCKGREFQVQGMAYEGPEARKSVTLVEEVLGVID